MGGNQSRNATRKLTVENDDPTSVIKVSDDVVERIRNNQHKGSPRDGQEPRVDPTVIHPPSFMYEPSLTTVQLRQANVAELKKNDQYWENRLKSMQANHRKINEVLDTEYRRAIDELGAQGGLESKTKKLIPPCQDKKEAVLKCYRENSREPMQCARVVEAFQACVDLKRASIIESRG